MVVLYYGRVSTCVTTFIAGAFWLLISLAKDLNGDLFGVNEAIQDGGSVSKALDRFSGLIELHSNTKQLSTRTFIIFLRLKIQNQF